VSHTEKAVMILKLATANALTSPRLTDKARKLTMGYLGKPGFLTGYVAQAPNREAAVADLMQNLAKLGISAETGLKNIAA
jgi:hypothetical protein